MSDSTDPDRFEQPGGRGPGLDEGQLAEAEAESDVLDADLEQYAEQPYRESEMANMADLDDEQLAEAEAEG
jgi:hypothetical protein